MGRRVATESLAMIALLIVVLAAFLFTGDYVDPCLSAGPSCHVHAGIPPLLVVGSAAILWVLVLSYLILGRRDR